MNTTNFTMNRLLSKTTKPHGTTSSLHKLPFDLNVFKEPKSECFKLSPAKSGDIPITERCSRLTRLCAALRYIEALRASTKLDEASRKELAVDFSENVYGSVLDDVAHFVKEHDGDIQRVHSEWTELYGFAKCSVSDCVQTERHYGGGRRDRKRERESKEESALHAFYESVYDRVHHYIFHLYEVGLRVDVESLNFNGNRGDEKEVENEKRVQDLVARSRQVIFATSRRARFPHRAPCTAAKARRKPRWRPSVSPAPPGSRQPR